MFCGASPLFLKQATLSGPQLRFRPAAPDDAQFILGLRLDEEKGKYLSPTSPDIIEQEKWIRTSNDDPSQVYFLIEDHIGKQIGTVRIYGPRDTAFCWGSWILVNDRPISAAVESTLMVYFYALLCGFDKAYFDVRRENTKVWQYHERMGAVRTGETDQDFYYEMGTTTILDLLGRFQDRIGGSIKIAPAPGQHAMTVTVAELVSRFARRVVR